MIRIDRKENCTGCQACSVSCPKNCITMSDDHEGFLYPQIDSDKCIDCHLCEKICPVYSTEKRINQILSAVVAINKDDETRLASTSGGVFYLLARHIIESGGCVFGAALSSDLKVHHICIDAISEIKLLQGSKYVQSDVENSYQEVKKQLQSKRTVMFSGTPCQIAGLVRYLGKTYDNLITLDIVCHGIPSPYTFKTYLEYLQNKHRVKIKTCSFRNKKEGWRDYSFEYLTDTGKVFYESRYRSGFLLSFLKNYTLRPSCYECKFKGMKKDSDITLADCWTIKKYYPDMDDDKGVSLVYINSQKGKELFYHVQDKMTYHKLDSIDDNASLLLSAERPVDRDSFWENLNNHGWEWVKKEYFNEPFHASLIRFAKRIIKKSI